MTTKVSSEFADRCCNSVLLQFVTILLLLPYICFMHCYHLRLVKISYFAKVQYVLPMDLCEVNWSCCQALQLVLLFRLL